MAKNIAGFINNHFINKYLLIQLVSILSLLCHTTIPPTLLFVSLCFCIHLYTHPLPLHLRSAGCRPSCPPALLFSDEANGGTSIKGHQVTLLLAVHQSLYSDWLTGRGLVALPFHLTFPADPKVLTNPTTCLHTHVQDYVWIKYAHSL